MIRRTFYITTSLLFSGLAVAGPKEDQSLLKQHYQRLFPTLELKDYSDAIYAIDPIARESWEAIEEFPPYEPSIDQGEVEFNTPFKNGKTYSDCFPDKGVGIANRYPKWDSEKKEVVTLARAVNVCRTTNGEPALPYKKGKIAQILAYMAYTSRGKPIEITVPDEPEALAAYEEGKKYYYQRRGQLNFSCATCHIQNAGKKIRVETLSPMLGHTSGWPVYRLKWGQIGTLHRRFIGCHKQIRAMPPSPQSRELGNLEYFMSYTSNGVPSNGPTTRK